jgi:hypothetical protein
LALLLLSEEKNPRRSAIEAAIIVAPGSNSDVSESVRVQVS